MKNQTAYVKKMTALLKRVRQEYKVEAPPPRDPVTQMVVAFLEWNATPNAAREAYQRITAVLVDNNDLRVSHPHEVVELLGGKYARGPERAARLHEALQEIFVREHGMALEELGGKPKKQIRTYFDTLPGMTSFVAAQVVLLSFGGHCIPVDETLAEILHREGAVEPTAGVDEIAAFLEKLVKAGEATDTHLALQAWAVAGGRGHGSGKSSASSAPRHAKKSAAPKKPAKKSASKR